MIHSQPHHLAEGAGPLVICLHSSAASSRQWEALIRELRHDFRVVAPDLYGHGGSPEWRSGEGLTLADEAAFVGSLLDEAADGVHLVGHSYGAAVALKLALSRPSRVRSLTLYEPTLFPLLFDEHGIHPTAAEIACKAIEIRQHMTAGRVMRAAAVFVDYWGGAGQWAVLEPRQREAIARRMAPVMGNFDALFGDTSTREQLARLDVPTLCLSGSESPAPARQIAAILGRTLPRVALRTLEAMGHMAPLLHGTRVNAIIQDFLRGFAAGAASRAEAAVPV